MAGPQKLNAWQKRRRTLIINLIDGTTFGEKLELLRMRNDTAHGNELYLLMIESNIPIDCHNMLKSYVTNGIWNYDLVIPPVQIIDEGRSTIVSTANSAVRYAYLHRLRELGGDNAVYIRLDNSMTKKELTDFIDDNWESKIKPLLPKHELLDKKIRIMPSAKIHKRTQELLNAGSSHKQIAEDIMKEFNIVMTAEDVTKIKYLNKQHHI